MHFGDLRHATNNVSSRPATEGGRKEKAQTLWMCCFESLSLAAAMRASTYHHQNITSGGNYCTLFQDSEVSL